MDVVLERLELTAYSRPRLLDNDFARALLGEAVLSHDLFMKCTACNPARTTRTVTSFCRPRKGARLKMMKLLASPVCRTLEKQKN